MSAPVVQAFRHADTGTWSYVVHDPAGGAAAIIDPALDFDAKSGRTGTASAQALVEYVRTHALDVQWVLETHAHADHLSAAHWLKSAHFPQARIAIGEGKRAADVLAGRKQVTEGASNVVAVAQLARNFKVEMPITLALDAILADKVALEDAIKLVMRTMPALWRTGKAGTREVLHV